MPFKAKAACRHHIPKQQHRVINWAAYDAGLRARGSLTVWFTSEATAAWAAAPRTSRGGQPSYSDLAIATTLTVRAAFRLVPDHSTLSRRAERICCIGGKGRAALRLRPAQARFSSSGAKRWT